MADCIAAKCKIRVLRPLEDVFPQYQPIVGKIYDAEHTPGHKHREGHHTGNKEFCIINIQGKRIVLRKSEFEIVGGGEDGNET